MPRHSKSGAYDDPRDHDRRFSQDPRHAPNRGDVLDPRDTRDTRDTRSSREPLLSRDPREVRYFRERRNLPDSRDPEGRAEISVARRSTGLREPREPTYRTEPEEMEDEMEIDNTHQRDRSYPRDPRRSRDPREIAAASDSRYVSQDQRDIGLASIGRDARQLKDDLVDPRHANWGRDEREIRELQGGRGYGRDAALSSRNDVIGQGTSRLDYQRDSTSAMPARTTTYFLPAEGISPEVLQAELGNYLGPEASWRFTTSREARTQVQRLWAQVDWIVGRFRLPPHCLSSIAEREYILQASRSRTEIGAGHDIRSDGQF
jgi:hypothetical protein